VRCGAVFSKAWRRGAGREALATQLTGNERKRRGGSGWGGRPHFTISRPNCPPNLRALGGRPGPPAAGAAWADRGPSRVGPVASALCCGAPSQLEGRKWRGGARQGDRDARIAASPKTCPTRDAAFVRGGTPRRTAARLIWRARWPAADASRQTRRTGTRPHSDRLADWVRAPVRVRATRMPASERDAAMASEAGRGVSLDITQRPPSTPGWCCADTAACRPRVCDRCQCCHHFKRACNTL